MRIESNLGSKLVKFTNILSDMQVHTEQALRMAALDAVAIVQTRIQQRGEGVDGMLKTKSADSFGAYGQRHGKYRNRLGFQTGIIDWTLTGQLFLDWQILSVSTTEASIGFRSLAMNERADKIEFLNGEGFGLRQDEKEQVLETFVDSLWESMEIK